MKNIIVCIISIFCFISCENNDLTETETTLFIASKTINCIGMMPSNCLLIKEKKEKNWEAFYSTIKGFSYEEGFEYELLVSKKEIENPPEDASSIQYTLLEIVSKIAKTSDNLLIGNWSEPIYDGEQITFTRTAALPREQYGISFNDGNVYLESTSGWCGTPPLSFFNIEGTYQLKNTLITISKNNHTTDYAWRIVNITETTLIVKRELTEQEIEHQNLINLFYEIEKMANNKTCTNSDDLTFTAYGSKACGGPQGYIAYSTKINVADFLKKVTEYTNKEKAFNVKWGIISTCDIPNRPVDVTCLNNTPTLTYNTTF